LSPLIINKVTDIIKKSIEHKRYIRIKHKGTEVENVKPDELKKVLDTLFEKDNSATTHHIPNQE
jgi:hypothetical protein